MFKTLKTLISDSLHQRRLPDDAKEELKRDLRGLPLEDPGKERAIKGAIDWICHAQDGSLSGDGGVARAYSLITGWSSSYPETTGYIIPTFLEYARRTGSEEMRSRARRMLDWLTKIQMPSGAFQGGRIDSTPVTPVTFNTGQILLGLSSGEQTFGGYRGAMVRAANWLVEVQDGDGCWRRYASPFAGKGDKTYDTHSAWALFEAARIEPTRGYGEAASANVMWALSHQRKNGWIDHCCLGDNSKPLTHTLGYALRGILEAYRFTHDSHFLDCARKTADGLCGALKDDGFLPGQLAADWSAAAKWACLTGTVQVAICWMMLFQDTNETRYLDAAVRANRFVRRTLRFDVPPERAGGVKGSFPVNGRYGRYEYPNWAAKFLIDSLFLETDICSGAYQMASSTASIKSQTQIR